MGEWDKQDGRNTIGMADAGIYRHTVTKIDTNAGPDTDTQHKAPRNTRPTSPDIPSIPPPPPVYDTWLLGRKVRAPWPINIEEDVGDSCCFGTRTVDVGTAWIWDERGGM